MPEALFWKTMNPARLVRLYNAHFNTEKNNGRKKADKEQNVSLYAYLMGGG